MNLSFTNMFFSLDHSRFLAVAKLESGVKLKKPLRKIARITQNRIRKDVPKQVYKLMFKKDSLRRTLCDFLLTI